MYFYPFKVFSVNWKSIETVFPNQWTNLQIKIFQLNNEKDTESVMFSLTEYDDFESTEADIWWLSSLQSVWLERCPQDRGKALTYSMDRVNGWIVDGLQISLKF